MSTLQVMRQRIGNELRRGNAIDTQINDAIKSAIDTYQDEKFFKKDGSNTLALVINQSDYTSADDDWIRRINRIDYVHLLIAGIARRLFFRSNEWMDFAITVGNKSDPRTYGYFAETLRFYPIPSEILTVRVSGSFWVDPPASDNEANNPWMIQGEALIRSQAKFELYTHVLNNPKKAAEFNPENQASPTAIALRSLRKKSTAKTTADPYVQPWSL